MSLYRTLYYMSLVGGIAGLLSWVFTTLLSAAFANQSAVWISDLIAAFALGGFIGGMTVGFSDYWSGNRVTTRWVVSGILVGTVAGLTAGLVQIPITNKISGASPFLARLIAWMLVGSFIGIGLGLRWVQVNRARVAHAFAGGLLGGASGGIIFMGLGSSIPDLSQALGFVAVGVGICLGVTLAPILLRDGVLQFISSGDARAQSKFGRAHKEWEVQQGDSYVIGSEWQDLSHTRYRPGIDIFIPDAAIARRHAVLFGKSGRFFLARHPDCSDEASLARFQLRVRGKTVIASQELRDSDDILLGRTALKFLSRKET
jgi:MFS family permease